MEKSNRNRMGK